MKRLLIIPRVDDLEKSIVLAVRYNLGFEYSDFSSGDVLDDERQINKLIDKYFKRWLPDCCTLHGAYSDINISSPDRRIKAASDLRVRQSLAAAEKIGAGTVIFHTNYNPFYNSEEYVDNWVRVNADYWYKLLREYPDVNIYLENCFDSTPYVMARLAESLIGVRNFGVCLDYAHCALSPVPCEKWAETLGKYVKHIHISDNDLTSDQHLALGEGKIDWREFLGIYDAYMSDATVLIETPTIEKQEKSLAYLKEMWAI